MSLNHRNSERKQGVPEFEQMPAAGEAAIERDKAWFRANPEKTRRRRRVRRCELPPSLRTLDIAEVRIERAGPRHFTRTFFDRHGQPVASGMDMYDEPVVPDVPERTISVSQRGECVVNKTSFSAADRDWFEQHPGEASYTRPITPEERLLVETPPGYECIGGAVVVTKIDATHRTREVNALIAPIDGKPQ
jgi:hypothetical protein